MAISGKILLSQCSTAVLTLL